MSEHGEAIIGIVVMLCMLSGVIAWGTASDRMISCVKVQKSIKQAVAKCSPPSPPPPAGTP